MQAAGANVATGAIYWADWTNSTTSATRATLCTDQLDRFINPAANISFLQRRLSRDVSGQTTTRRFVQAQVRSATMLNRQDRFFAPGGAIYPGGPSIWHVVDWDQRRLVSVKMDEEQESEDVAFEHLLKHIDTLPPDVHLVHLSPVGDILSSSNDPEDDETVCVFRPPVDAAQLPDDVAVTSRAELQEVARLGPNVDMVVKPRSIRPEEKLVFKYFFLLQHLDFNWHEMSLWCRLEHPTIVPFDSVIVDEVEGHVVGFTSKYIAGGTLEENHSRIFKLKWLHQLMDVVDDLNLHLGVAHQDVAPRNILIEESTDTLMLFDFDSAARIGLQGYSEPRNDVKGVVFTLYEIITRDSARRGKRHEDQDVEAVEQMTWTKHPHVQLDHPVSEFRRVLGEWCERRRKGTSEGDIGTEPASFLEYPTVPEPPVTTQDGVDQQPGTQLRRQFFWRRRDLVKESKTVLNWQRPPQKWPEKSGVVVTTQT
ncbi:hypothetical protein LLEC1_07008 [Akanthomyces lecanii]|uniref:Protein kinase domain-containing protein n=1 Tax=Cordyceps confragosa TaxID=2714763 RepID=A0A179IDQ1_CORDF|nr:hypothetical protein LLEC1_07008 [Akanthomyces lecanii]